MSNFNIKLPQFNNQIETNVNYVMLKNNMKGIVDENKNLADQLVEKEEEISILKADWEKRDKEWQEKENEMKRKFLEEATELKMKIEELNGIIEAISYN